MIFFASNQRIADLGTTRQLGLGQGVRYPSVESTDITNFMNMVENTIKTNRIENSGHTTLECLLSNEYKFIGVNH